MNVTGLVISAVAGLLAGLGGGYGLKVILERQTRSGLKELTKNAQREAETMLKEARITAKEELLRSREQFEQESKERRREIARIEQRLDQRETNIERKSDLMESRMSDLDKREGSLRQSEEALEKERSRLDEVLGRKEAELVRVAALTPEQARQEIMAGLQDELEEERGSLIRRFQEETRQRCENEAREVMINAMQRYANECAYERTTSTIPLPGDEMKGRIIGREGRNIRTIEAATGVSVLIDDTPEAVVISCFDPVRREIARQAMERLVADGRIHPTRVEEMVEKARKDVESAMVKAGQDAVDELGLRNLKPNVVRLLGSLKYRYSYSQNVLRHSIECAYMMGLIAGQLGLDERLARRAGLLHDIGKAVDHEVEGTHAAIGADILKRAGEPQEIVNAVAAHHEEVEKSSLLGVLVSICDTLSASRPGARSESTELYLKRLEQLEGVGNSIAGVEKCYAIQAGRELRVIVEPENIDESRAALLAREIAGKVEKEVQYPGQVKVTVVRETRATEYAK